MANLSPNRSLSPLSL